ncbi:hypothetical protein DTO280E4_1552 [Paecilomyces variotii]|nr:hypothetical protein DTO169E5_684 [Paecilomyces variotii]KAJ9252446.1 hypothetical protein DTO207G8_4787 [Paecilomyces variotii]KAJ9364306.1 hypothetical protein DTO280E4_1552 [Paecilomyces variotii]KAJ9376981.1 hypothetical protein DTO063F5_8473 [Paecilomyces variotii]
MAQDGMSIIPYHASNRDVVLRHNDSVVVLDRESRQLVIRRDSNSHNDNDIELIDCPYCHRPMRDGEAGRQGRHGSTSSQAEFVNPDYFRLLHNSLPNSTDTPGPPSPRRRLVQPVLADGPTTGSSDGGRTPGPQGISAAAFSQNYFKNFFVEETELGRGGKGVVLLVKHVLDGVSLGHYACKRVPVGDDHEWLEKVLAEVQLLQHLSHQNLVSYRHVWLEDVKLTTFGPSVPCAFILQQYCNAGDLHKYIYGSAERPSTAQQLKERLRRRSKGQPEPPSDLSRPRKLHFEEIYSFFKDITSGLRFLHANGYIHRDLKPSNCLLHKTGDELRVLVSDFGEVQSENTARRSTGATGTVSYCAPEVLRQEYPGGPFGNFTFKSDVFSLGMILYFLCFAQLPYRNADIINEEKEDLDQLRAEISQWGGFDDERRIRADLPEKLYTFLRRLLSVDPARRPTADEVLTGIQAGVNGNENRRFARASSASPDFRSSSRIQPVDSPAPESDARLTQSPSRRTAVEADVGMRQSPLYESRKGATSQTPETDRRLSGSPEGHLILRPRYSPSPSLSPFGSPEQDDHYGSHHIHRPPLLPPPPTRFSLQTITFYLRYFSYRHVTLPLLQVSFFLVKIIAAFQPCSPLAVNPWVFYPLLFLATVTLGARSVRAQSVALILHLAVVALCYRSALLWDTCKPLTNSPTSSTSISAATHSWTIMPKDSPAEKKRRLDVGSCVKKETSEDGGSQGDFWDRFKRLLYSSDHSDVKLHIGKQMIPFPGHSLARISNTLPQSLPTQFSTERDIAFEAHKDTWIVSMMLEYIYTGNYSRVLSHFTISNIMPTTGHCLRVSH